MNVALGIEYSGTEYCGKIANHTVNVFCAGRTDSGVHATGQVVNFQLDNPRPLKAWHMGANTLLPDDIGVRWAVEMPENFHARHSATARRYRYVILNAQHRSPTLANKVTWYPHQLDADVMHLSAQALIGEQSFASFQASSCQSTTPFRCVHEVSVTRWGEFVIVDIKANAFLHHMVRNIVGCLLEIGQGKQAVGYVKELLAKQDRSQAPATAKPDGLYLINVEYPETYKLPALTLGPLCLPDKFI